MALLEEASQSGEPINSYCGVKGLKYPPCLFSHYLGTVQYQQSNAGTTNNASQGCHSTPEVNCSLNGIFGI